MLIDRLMRALAGTGAAVAINPPMMDAAKASFVNDFIGYLQ